MKRRLLGILLVLVLLVGTVVVVLNVETRAAPQWYAPPDAGDRQVALLAERVEKRLAEEVTAIREDNEVWTLRVRDEQINTWLSVRLEEWIEGRGLAWPENLGVPQVRTRPGALNLAFPLGGPGGRVASIEFVPRTDEAGLWLDVSRVRIGRVPIPGSPATALATVIGDAAPNSGSDDVLKVLTGQRPMQLRFRLGDERQIEIRDVRCTEGALDVASVTVGP